MLRTMGGCQKPRLGSARQPVNDLMTLNNESMSLGAPELRRKNSDQRAESSATGRLIAAQVTTATAEVRAASASRPVEPRAPAAEAVVVPDRVSQP